jgi:hypothetical protein
MVVRCSRRRWSPNRPPDYLCCPGAADRSTTELLRKNGLKEADSPLWTNQPKRKKLVTFSLSHTPVERVTIAIPFASPGRGLQDMTL